MLEIQRASKGQGGAAAGVVKVEAAQRVKDALRAYYLNDVDSLLADPEFTAEVGEGERHYFLQSLAGYLHDGTRTEEDLREDLLKLRDRFAVGKSDYEVERIAEWTSRKQPVDVEPMLPRDGRVTVGGEGRGDEGRKGVVQFKYPRREGRVFDYVLDGIDGAENGWFPRGRVHAIAGSSGSGKSRFIVQMLRAQQARQYFFAHRGRGLDYSIIACDRGRLTNQEMLIKMNMPAEARRYGYVSGAACDERAVEEILDIIEGRDSLPEVVFIEGADLMMSDANKMQVVAGFISRLRIIAEHYHLSIILSLGSGKHKQGEGYSHSRDRAFGSSAFSRTLDMMAVLSLVPGDKGARVLTVSHRHAEEEEINLRFDSSGFLVEDRGAEPELHKVDQWIAGRQGAEFTRAEIVSDMKKTQTLGRSAILDRIKVLVREGKLVEAWDPEQRCDRLRPSGIRLESGSPAS